jgi:hypothetical protein
MVTELLAVAGDAQAAFEVTVTDTTSLLFKVELLNEELLVPALTPFTCHWYVGDAPPLIVVVVKVTGVPGQILLADGAILTEGVTRSLTVIVTMELVTEAGRGQVALEVKMTVTLSPLTKVEEL